MNPPVVVGLHELIDEVLELADCVRWWPRCEPFFHGLLEPFNFAGRGGMVRSSVFLGDVEVGEPCLNLVASA